MKNSAHRIAGGLAALAAVAILMAACAGTQPTVAPTASPTVAPTASPTAIPTVAPTASPTAAPTPSPTEPSANLGADGYPEIALLKPFIPSAIWNTCTPATLPPKAGQSAYCLDAGVGVYYDLYTSPADLKAALAAETKLDAAKPATTTLTCANSNVIGTWSFTGKPKNQDNGLLCYKFTDTTTGKVIASILQADPTTNVMFTVELIGGDQKALYDLWLKNATLVEP